MRDKRETGQPSSVDTNVVKTQVDSLFRDQSRRSNIVLLDPPATTLGELKNVFSLMAPTDYLSINLTAVNPIGINTYQITHNGALLELNIEVIEWTLYAY